MRDGRPSQLSEYHYRMLAEASGIADEVIAGRGYRAISDVAKLEPLNFALAQRRAPVQSSLFGGASR